MNPNFPPTPGADWYPDPRDPTLLRYWDGRQWTSHTAPRPAGWSRGSQQWSSYRQPANGIVVERRPTKTRFPAWAIITLVATVIVMFGGVVALGVVAGGTSTQEAKRSTGRDVNMTASEPTTSEPAEAVGTTSAPPTETVESSPTETEPPRSVVPRLKGLTRDEAEDALTDAGLVVSEISQVYSAEAPGTVLSQSMKVGRSVLEGSEVALVVAKAYPEVPGVVGRLKAAAVDRLQEAGFKVIVKMETRTSGKDGVVLRQTPGGDDRAEPGSTITIVVSSVVRTVVEPPSNCTPGYDPCLTPASDYDCAGGSGDGPKYTGFVHVTGSDPYDLDADGDGVACE
ncbi:PASTA domain-containing protein [Nocardioides stalactiti]|uniref:PASTA domain-containing protein n=1 Tax=Nocardioides stalactiti TaxID=2755356 RepID=UPI0016047AAB|nr:PASTA domain-containing protein [Nocardioides stalactiti]